MNHLKSYLLGFLLFLSFGNICIGQSPASVSERKTELTTYPFSDPDPIAAHQKLYPYFRFDGFSSTPIQKEWKVVILENDYLRIEILPEIGGKIWSAFDKINKRDFIYKNGVVKFRDIAMRGPWTSGGIEANYGVIGHTPNTSTSVDYLIKQEANGAASCVIHTLDLLSRTRWSLEIKLEKDKGYFSTKSFWSNTNSLEMPYYTWMNLGVAAGDDLQFIYPGNKYIGHDGKTHGWPIDEKGRNLSNYKENAFGSSKSYHVLGAPSQIFGAYWKAENMGMARYANREEKLGKKIFLWAQSGSGKIWEDLLTDKSGQYVEIQSGRLFNQNAYTSSETPYKQIGFHPYQTDQWEEYWLPFQAVGKPTVINLIGAFSIHQQGRKLEIKIDPKQPISDSLFVYNAQSKRLGQAWVSGQIGKPISFTIDLSTTEKPHALVLNDTHIDLALDAYALERPSSVERTVGSQDSLALMGRDLLRFRLYGEAEPVIRKAYSLNPNQLSVLHSLVKLHWFKMEYDSALLVTQRGLTLDTYDPEMNYYYGLIQEKLGKSYDALDGFQVASLHAGWRAAAFTGMAKWYYREANFGQAKSYAQKALASNQNNIEALQLAYLSAKMLGENAWAQKCLSTLQQMDPLNPFCNFEQLWLQGDDISQRHFLQSVQQELRLEAFLELAIWYANIKSFDKARKILEIAPQNTETLYWLAWLNKDQTQRKDWLVKAQQSDVNFVFPFREETLSVLQWASQNQEHWKLNYLQALLYRYRNQSQKALALLERPSDHPIDFAPYFAIRSQLHAAINKDKAVADLKQSMQLDPKEWRYGKILTNYFRENKDYVEGLKIASRQYILHPKNYIMGMQYIRMLLLNKNYAAAEEVLAKIQILPFEGATDGHKYYEQAKLMLAYNAVLKNQVGLAKKKIDESRLWPKNLGVGEPYESEKQEFFSNWLAFLLYEKRHPSQAKAMLEKITTSKTPSHYILNLIQSMAFEKLGNLDKAKQIQDAIPLSQQTNAQVFLVKLREGKLSAYWTQMLSSVYQQEDQRIF